MISDKLTYYADDRTDTPHDAARGAADLYVRRHVVPRLMKFATRIPIFMYLTDYREESLEDVIRKLEPSLFERVTGLTIDDFDLLLRVGVFNRAQMNDAILKFRRYEDASLAYTGVNRHAAETRIGLMDSTVPIEALLG